MKKAITILLIVFAVISVAALVVKELSSEKKVEDVEAPAVLVQGRKIVVNYFHGDRTYDD